MAKIYEPGSGWLTYPSRYYTRAEIDAMVIAGVAAKQVYVSEFFYHGDALTDAEVFYYTALSAFSVKSVALEAVNSRLSGTLTATFRKNGTSFATVTLDNTNPLSHKTTGLNVSFAVNDRLSVTIGTSSYQPVANAFNLNILYE